MFCDGICGVGGLVDSLRVVGFSKEYTDKLVSLIRIRKAKLGIQPTLNLMQTPSNFYPGVHGHITAVSIGYGPGDIKVGMFCARRSTESDASKPDVGRQVSLLERNDTGIGTPVEIKPGIERISWADGGVLPMIRRSLSKSARGRRS